MGRQDERVVGRVGAHERGREQRSVDEVVDRGEGVVLDRGAPCLAVGRGQVGDVHDAQRDVGMRMDPLVLAIDVEGGPERLVALDQETHGRGQRLDIEHASQAQRGGQVVGRRAFVAELAQHPHVALDVGQGDPLDGSAGRDAVRVGRDYAIGRRRGRLGVPLGRQLGLDVVGERRDGGRLVEELPERHAYAELAPDPRVGLGQRQGVEAKLGERRGVRDGRCVDTRLVGEDGSDAMSDQVAPGPGDARGRDRLARPLGR